MIGLGIVFSLMVASVSLLLLKSVFGENGYKVYCAVILLILSFATFPGFTRKP